MNDKFKIWLILKLRFIIVIFLFTSCNNENSKRKQESFTYHNPPMILEDTVFYGPIDTIYLSKLPNPQPDKQLKLKNATPLTERLFKIALDDIKHNIVETDEGKYFGGGTHFGPTVFTRDMSYAGILALNKLYPDVMRQSLELARKIRKDVGFKISTGYELPEVDIEWDILNLSDREYKEKFNTNSYLRRTDDVVWLWAAWDLINENYHQDDLEWIYKEGNYFFKNFYQPFYDPTDGLYRGQATFIDIHFQNFKATGYPQDWSIDDCLLIKATSTNCLYYQGLLVMEEVCKKLGKDKEAIEWKNKASKLKVAINKELRNEDGTFAYYKDRWGNLAPRREVFGTALVVLTGIVNGHDAKKAMAGYPITDIGIPVFHPFFETDNFYHNNATWPHSDAFFVRALEKVHNRSYANVQAMWLTRLCGDVYPIDRTTPNHATSQIPSDKEDVGTFHELVDARSKKVTGSGRIIWGGPAFIDVCERAGLIKL
jgi:hypothetical protein